MPAPDEAGTKGERRRGRLTLGRGASRARWCGGDRRARFRAARRGRGSNPARTPAVIVLPFEAFGDAEDIGLIASGVTEELIANLMLFQDFRVYSTTASFRQDAGADPENLRRDLGVSFVVSGVMQSENGQVHLRARAGRRADGRGALERQLRRTA